MTPKNPLESTATPQGQIMAQVLSTFNRIEQSRFEAFRRSTFSGNAVSNWIAHCMIEQRPDEGLADQQPILSHLCETPGQANEITIIVSTLAKIYAQRLCTEARKYAETNQPVEPHHILQAFEQRRARGLDPGLFLQPTQSAIATVFEDDSFEMRRLAAVQLQEIYDKQQASKKMEVDDVEVGKEEVEHSPETQKFAKL